MVAAKMRSSVVDEALERYLSLVPMPHVVSLYAWPSRGR